MTTDQITEVLIVEDDEFNIHLLSEVCRNSGYVVRAVMDGEAALEAVDDHLPDLILLDVMIPRLDGFGVLERLRTREDAADLPVIMVTAVQSAEARARCVELGADDYVTKPFRIAELRTRMQSALAVRRFKQELGPIALL